MTTNATSPSLLQCIRSCPNLLSKSPALHILGILYFCASRGFGRCLTAISKTTSCKGAFFHAHFFLSSSSISYNLIISLKLTFFFFIEGIDKAQFSLADPKATLPSLTFTFHFSLYSGSAICIIKLLKSAINFINLSCIASGVNLSSFINLSTLLINRTGLTLSLKACFNTVSVCGIIPSTAQTRTKVPSIALIALVTLPPKSTCPGVSIKLIKYSSSWNL